MKTCPCNDTVIFKIVNNENFQYKMSDIFLIFAQNIDYWYTLEPPRRGGSNEYPQSMFWGKIRKIGNPCIPQFFYIKVGFKGVDASRTYFPDVLNNVNPFLQVWAVWRYKEFNSNEDSNLAPIHIHMFCRVAHILWRSKDVG